MISGQRCLVRGRVTSEAELLEVTPAGLHSIVARDPELSKFSCARLFCGGGNW